MDLLIHDAQYTADEYPAKRGWGDSTVEYVVATAPATGVRRVALFLHDPLRDDDAVDKLLQRARARVAGENGQLEVLAASEGHTLELEAPAAGRPSSAVRDIVGVSTRPPALTDQSALIAVNETAAAVALTDAIGADELTLHIAENAEAVLQIVRARQPSLVILESELQGGTALEVSRAIRDAGGAYAEHVPIVVVPDNEDAINRQAAAQVVQQVGIRTQFLTLSGETVF